MSFIKKLIPPKIKQILSLLRQYIHDFGMYYIHSSIFKINSYEKIESEITLRYHSIEKGFLYNPPRARFAKKRVVDLITLLNKIKLDQYKNRIQIQSALLCLCKYYEYHSSISIDISDYFYEKNYDLYKQLLVVKAEPVKNNTKEIYFQYINSSFKLFSTSRASVRSFTGEKIKVDLIYKVINLANHAPSVCNRQSVNVHLVENKLLIDKILEIQGGLKGYSANLSQLIILTSDRNFFYSVGERHQLYIEGGIYLMNLLYALHFHGVGACPAHWGMPYQADIKMTDLLNLKNSEQIISLVAIGVLTNEFNTTLSLRKTSDENLFIHN